MPLGHILTEPIVLYKYKQIKNLNLVDSVPNKHVRPSYYTVFFFINLTCDMYDLVNIKYKYSTILHCIQAIYLAGGRTRNYPTTWNNTLKFVAAWKANIYNRSMCMEFYKPILFWGKMNWS